MKIVKRLLALAFVVTFILVLSGFTSQENNAAMVITQDAGCGISDFDFGGVYNVPLHSVTNHGGNSILICKGKDFIGTGVARQWHGFLCGTYLGTTTNSYLVISADGKATLRCQVKKPKL